MAEKIERLEIHLSYSCKNNCVFCSERNRLKKFNALHLSGPELARVLKAKRRSGFSHVTFTGGEPSLPGTLPAALGMAKALGYKTCVTTNGLGFASAAFARRVVPLLDEVILSCHGASAAAHDALTGKKGSFAATLTALANLSAVGGKRLYLMVNTVVTRENAGQLPRILRLISGFGAVRHYLVSYPAPEGGACSRYGELAADLKTLRGRVAGLCAAARSAGITLRFFGFPACALGRHAAASNDFYYSPRLTIERAALPGGAAGLKETRSLRPVRRRVYLKTCAPCRFRGSCGGVFKKYLQTFPGQAGLFRPVLSGAGEKP